MFYTPGGGYEKFNPYKNISGLSAYFPEQEKIIFERLVSFETPPPDKILSDPRFRYNLCPHVANRVLALGNFTGCMHVRIAKLEHVHIPKIDIPSIVDVYDTGIGLAEAALRITLLYGLFGDKEAKEYIDSLLVQKVCESYAKLAISSVYQSPGGTISQVNFLRKTPIQKRGKKPVNEYFVSGMCAHQEKGSFIVEMTLL